MRQVLIIFFICCAYASTLAQIQVGVWTDHSLYQYGDTVAITVTAFNPSADTICLSFASACQANYIIDNFNLKYHIVCAMILTSVSIPPYSTAKWDYFTYPIYGQPPLSIGSHVVVGEVLGYGISQPLLILVTTVTSVEVDDLTPDGFLLSQNYPNPFSGVTWIPFTLASPGRVRIDLFNSLGQSVRTILDDYYTPGSHLVRVDLNNASSGSYWCRLETRGKAQTIRLVLSK